MPGKDETALVQVKIRMHEPLRARLEASAREAGYSLSTEIVRRLEESIRDDDLGRAVFGSAERFGILQTIDRLSLAIQLTRKGKGWEDRETRYLIADTVSSFIKHGAEIFATIMSGKTYSPSPEGARAVADAFALHATAKILHDHLERMTEGGPEVTPPGEGERPHG